METKVDIIFLGDHDHGDPLYRIYFDTLSSELIFRGFTVHKVSPKENLSNYLNGRAQVIINFFYKDRDSIRAIQLQTKQNLSVFCFCSDIDSYLDYRDAYEVADCLICPSEAHKQVLQYVYDLPIYYLKEAIDPTLTQVQHLNQASDGARVVWFGFPESYYKSMVGLESTIIQALGEKLIESFSVISAESLEAKLPREFNFIKYDVDNFAKHLSQFNVTILSHIPMDLRVNTLIKSPNKACSAIVSGLIPICSDTPNYRVFLAEIGLQDQLFDSPKALLNVLGRLAERSITSLENEWVGASGSIRDKFSAAKQCRDYLEIIDSCDAQISGLQGRNRGDINFYSPPVEDIKLRFYFRQQLKKVKKMLHLKWGYSFKK